MTATPSSSEGTPPTLPDRRRLLQAGLSGAAVAVSGCGGGSEATETLVDATAATAEGPTAKIAAAPMATRQPDTSTQANTARYRYQHPVLYQSVPGATTASRLAAGQPFAWGLQGTTYTHVDLASGWSWDNPGGDWLDANLVRQGTTPWFSIKADAVAGSTAVANYQVDVTRALQFVQQRGRWNAFILRDAGSAYRTIAGRMQRTWPVPVIEVVYTDGSRASLKCLHSAVLSKGSTMSLSTAAKLPNPTTLEFERPARAVQSAVLKLTIVEHWSGKTPQVNGFLVDPPINAAPQIKGIAATAGSLDANLASSRSIIGVHRYVDGSRRSDFFHPTTINFGAEREYDPAIFGNGPTDKTKLPHVGLGKWINAGDNHVLVNSSYRGEGFVPLAPGLGAMKVTMAAEPGVQDGSVVGYSGTGGSNAVIFLPEPDFGLLKRIFIRYYLRIGTPYVTPFYKRYQVRQSATSPAATWTDMAGKFGICPAHDTSYGGTSGSSGGGNGWQMRLSWADCDAEQGGPNENALSVGLHLYDFIYNNPKGHNYGAGDAPAAGMLFGQKGGQGGVLYPGQWYCVEMEVDLNSVPRSPGWLPDGAVRMWIDGRLAYERTSMVMRSLPLYAAPAVETRIRPIRELGHRNLWFNWYHGGKTVNTIDRTLFVTGLAWGREYIGPMAA